MPETTPAPEQADRLLAETEEPLRRVFERGRRAHPGLPLDPEAFSRRVLEITSVRLARAGLPLTRERVSDALARVEAADLYLAVACERRVPGAWEALTDRLLPPLRSLAIKAGAPASLVDELVAELPGFLLLAPGRSGARPRISGYEGTGTLLSWMFAILYRRIGKRRSRERETTKLPAEAGAAPGPDPVQVALDAESARRVEQALGAAWEQLTVREAVVLRARFGEGLPQKEIALLLGVGEPRISRLLAHATARVRSLIERQLPGGVTERPSPGLWEALREAVAGRLARTGSPRAQRREEAGP